MKTRFLFFCFTVLVFCLDASARYSRQDSLRGSNGRGRDWWDVTKYDLLVEIDTAAKHIKGLNAVSFRFTQAPRDSFQIDLREGLVIDSVWVWKQAPYFHEQRLSLQDTGRFYKSGKVYREGNVWWVIHDFKDADTSLESFLLIWYHGKPRDAVNPPWDGGFVWTKDSTGHPWIAVACQGLGASSWWPCKDYQGDEPDKGMNLSIGCGKLEAIANGRGKFMRHKIPALGKEWEVTESHVRNPINTYNATFYIGDYVSWTDTFRGEKGVLDLSFYPLRYHEEKAREHFKVVKEMLRCFEYWMGPYPFYEDGYKLVEAPYLGMEHQSAIAYGNEYKMGYRGADRSGTGVGLLFDFIIIHESGHEWFGNNITAKDIADNWLHEGFTTYTETLFAEWIAGKEKAFEYCRGEWKNIRNDRPVTGSYGVQDDGSSDKYDKGAAVVHMIRMIMNDDAKFRRMLRGLNAEFYHKTVTGAEIEAYIISFAGTDLSPLFDQYLRTVKIPQLEYYIKDKELHYRFTNTVPGFSLPIEAMSSETKVRIRPSADWQQVPWTGGYDISFSKDFLYSVK